MIRRKYVLAGITCLGISSLGNLEANLTGSKKEPDFAPKNSKIETGILLASRWKGILEKLKDQEMIAGDTSSDEGEEATAAAAGGAAAAEREPTAKKYRKKKTPKLSLFVDDLISILGKPNEFERREKNIELDLTNGGKEHLSKHLGQVKKEDLLAARIRLDKEEKIAIEHQLRQNGAAEGTNFFDISPILNMDMSTVANLANSEVHEFKERQERIQSAIATLRVSAHHDKEAHEKLAAIEKNMFDSNVIALCSMSGTCSKPVNIGKPRGDNAKANIEKALLKLDEVRLKAPGERNKRDYMDRFRWLNEIMNTGKDDYRDYNTGDFRHVDFKTEHGKKVLSKKEVVTAVKHMFKVTPEFVDGEGIATPERYVKANMETISTFIMKAKHEKTNPLEIMAKAYMAEITSHPCEDGNGRTAVMTSMSLAKDLGLPMPLYSKIEVNMMRALAGQMQPEQNITPLDAMRSVAKAMDRRLTFEESLLGIAPE